MDSNTTEVWITIELSDGRDERVAKLAWSALAAEEQSVLARVLGREGVGFTCLGCPECLMRCVA